MFDPCSDPVPLQVYADLWLVQHGPGWADVTPEMLIDADSVEGRMTRALAAAGRLEQHFLQTDMVFKAKLKLIEGA